MAKKKQDINLSKVQESALRFWHDKAGQYISSKPWDESFGCNYMIKEKMMRIGDGSAILIDQNKANLIVSLDKEFLPESSEMVNILANFDKNEFSARQTAMAWMISPDRTFPCLAIMPEKRSINSVISLSYSPESMVLCSPAKTIKFNAIALRSINSVLVEHGCESWAKVRGIIESRAKMDFMGEIENPNIRERIQKEYYKGIGIIPESIELPRKGTDQYIALQYLMTGKAAFPL